MDKDDFDAWVRLVDYGLGGDAAWSAHGNIVHDAEGDELCRAVSEDAARVIAAAMNQLDEIIDGPLKALFQEARGRVYGER